MNVFKYLREEFGDSTVKELRTLEDCQRKLARHRNHLVYTLRYPERTQLHEQRWRGVQLTDSL